ncbi:MAG: VCBS repeat-containing protein, partial [Planctomycetes bacterium]|nr:VCBS repeat-containing protein [Planctomycetota bacterium]
MALFLALGGVLGPSCAEKAPSGSRESAFPDEAQARGLRHTNCSGGPKKRDILAAGGAGVALLDLHSDGDLDAVFAQGCDSLAALISDDGADLSVFANTEGEFTELTGPGLNGWWTGLATGDLDSDGDTDLVAAGFGSLRVLLQDDDGALVAGPELLPQGARLSESGAPAWCTSVATLDVDRDGHLDLYVGRYLDLDPRAVPTGALGEGSLAVPCRWKGLDVYCGPRGLKAQPDLLLMGNGDGSFRDESQRLFGERAGYTL